MSKAILRVKGIHKKYHERIVLDGASFDIQPGTFTTLLGANGAGKSTLLRLLAGSEFPDQGSVLFKDLPVQNWDLQHKSELFYINENIHIESSLTMGKFAATFSQLFPRWHEALFQQMVKDRGIDLSRYYHQFSRGQKMQFNLMMALAASPEVLLLDEITSVMDVYSRRYFLGLLHRYCQSGKTVVMTTNIISELQYYTTDLLLLQNGKLKLQGQLADVKGGFIKLRFPAGHQHPFLSCPWLKWAGINADGSDNFLLDAERAASLPVPAEFLDDRETTLEDVFIFHYGEHHKGADHENAA